MIRKKRAPKASQPLMAVGTFVVDYHKVIEHYPRQRSRTRVTKELVSNGGAPLNILLNLAKLGVHFPLVAAGKVGCDLDGRMIVEYCRDHGIDITQLKSIENSSTGYTDVFTVKSTGRHTCFHFSGIGDTFSRRDVKLRAVAPKILFLGSLGALGKMDQKNPAYGRRGATQLIRDARKQGITTVIEIAPTDRVPGIAHFAETLAEADYLIMSDRLAEELLERELYAEGQFDPDLARQAASQILEHGLRKAVIIHSGSAAVFLGPDGSRADESSTRLPQSQRAGSAGVDHAFTAGFLAGLYDNQALATCLKQGLAVANACRTHLTPSEGIRSLPDCLTRYSKPS